MRMIVAAPAALDGSALRIKCKRNSKAVSVIVIKKPTPQRAVKSRRRRQRRKRTRNPRQSS